jgi:hypothetical protein
VASASGTRSAPGIPERLDADSLDGDRERLRRVLECEPDGEKCTLEGSKISEEKRADQNR